MPKNTSSNTGQGSHPIGMLFLHIVVEHLYRLAPGVSLDKRENALQLVCFSEEIHKGPDLEFRLILAKREKDDIRLNPFLMFQGIQSYDESRFKGENVPIRGENRNMLVIHTCDE